MGAATGSALLRTCLIPLPSRLIQGQFQSFLKVGLATSWKTISRLCSRLTLLPLKRILHEHRLSCDPAAWDRNISDLRPPHAARPHPPPPWKYIHIFPWNWARQKLDSERASGFGLVKPSSSFNPIEISIVLKAASTWSLFTFGFCVLFTYQDPRPRWRWRHQTPGWPRSCDCQALGWSPSRTSRRRSYAQHTL